MTREAIKNLFGGKKITLMGLGLLGRGVGDAEFFAEAGAELLVTDLKTEDQLAPSLARLKQFPNITYRLGEHRLEDFEHRDFVVRAPNAPLDSPFLAHARERGIPVVMDASLFAKYSGATIVGITGTRGKSTTTHLVYEIAKAAGKNPRLGGNERDTATLALLPETSPGDLVILELDSWQLQGFEEANISPHIAVWTNFMPDHMNYYHGDMERYFRDKAAIARFQTADDVFITTPEIHDTIEKTFGVLNGTCVTNAALPDGWTLALEGAHNRANAALALAASRALGISDEIARNVLENFHGLPGRMEYLGEKNGIAFYNDSNSTTPDATIAALTTLSAKRRPIVLIAGGSDKELAFERLATLIPKTVKHLVLFKGKATDKLLALLPKELAGSHDASGTIADSAPLASTMQEAFAMALAVAKPRDIILLSPGATSFGIFKNEYDRGDQFTALVRGIQQKVTRL